MRYAVSVAVIVCFMAVSTARGQLEADATTRGAGAITSSAVLKEYVVGDADALVRALKARFGSQSTSRFWATDSQSLSVWAPSAEQKRIVDLLKHLETAGRPISAKELEPKTRTLRPDHEEGSPPVTVTAYGNRLIVTSDDPEAMEIVANLARLLTQSNPGEGDFEVIPLRNAGAQEVAKILDEIFNGKAEPSNGRSSRGGGSSGGLAGMVLGAVGLGGGGSGARIEKVRIVADPAANTLIVKAAPLDMLSIHGFVDSLDRGPDDDVNAVKRTHVIGPLQNAAATDVATILRDVYKEALAGTQTSTSSISPFASLMMRSRSNRSSRSSQSAAQAPTQAALSIGVDEKTNTVVISASSSLYEDIEELVSDLDEAAGKARTAVDVIPVQSVSPSVLEQALIVLQQSGATTTRSTNSASTRSSGRGTTSGRGGR